MTPRARAPERPRRSPADSRPAGVSRGNGPAPGGDRSPAAVQHPGQAGVLAGTAQFARCTVLRPALLVPGAPGWLTGWRCGLHPDADPRNTSASFTDARNSGAGHPGPGGRRTGFKGWGRLPLAEQRPPSGLPPVARLPPPARPPHHPAGHRPGRPRTPEVALVPGQRGDGGGDAGVTVAHELPGPGDADEQRGDQDVADHVDGHLLWVRRSAGACGQVSAAGRCAAR